MLYIPAPMKGHVVTGRRGPPETGNWRGKTIHGLQGNGRTATAHGLRGNAPEGDRRLPPPRWAQSRQPDNGELRSSVGPVDCVLFAKRSQMMGMAGDRKTLFSHWKTGVSVRGDHEIEKPFLRNEAKSKEVVRATAGPAGHLAPPREIIAGTRPTRISCPMCSFYETKPNDEHGRRGKHTVFPLENRSFGVRRP